MAADSPIAKIEFARELQESMQQQLEVAKTRRGIDEDIEFFLAQAEALKAKIKLAELQKKNAK